jgi:probable F420-dependent oxidoreductase
MKVVCVLSREPTSAVPELARRAERLGYDAIRFSEITHDPMVCAAVAALSTREIRVGTFTLAFPRSPTVVAYQSWDLQRLSAGRFFLGLGSQVKGHIERRFGFAWTAPGPRMRDYILALRAVWECWQNGRPLNFQGDHYRLTLMTPEFNPGPIEHYPIPVYIGGVNRFMCRLAGEVADGLMLHSLTSPRYLREVVLPSLRAGARRAAGIRQTWRLSAGASSRRDPGPRTSAGPGKPTGTGWPFTPRPGPTPRCWNCTAWGSWGPGFTSFRWRAAGTRWPGT